MTSGDNGKSNEVRALKPGLEVRALRPDLEVGALKPDHPVVFLLSPDVIILDSDADE